ncbi:dTDP-4-dehydrorhamnose 3,5-epimerase [Actinacidiphila sp. DG2A-62]|uniref:dTDP-4-dehydrorhamnose 3,5-epimerase n=1 Tax=Actinacidiphila sp. DG2A-62 TaxID=3108821 RepID=UPI002DB8E845|nr:dTDP-4-dehydrorhamnose 3,5-epimerase [Actinacidiphila sp. DG2A-62]MEC3998825.1 dTDP-4-dehydrorhamnose 3,5-epimerase [Actinacidiphila sp. DG2A-62]
MRELGIPGAWLHEPRVFSDPRGDFHEWFKEGALAAATGRTLRPVQANASTSVRGSLRGVHYADVPPGQAKYVTCVRGAVLDVVVDLRVGSPTFGAWEGLRLDADGRAALFVSEGLGHAFMALTDDATVMYLCSQEYAPAREHGVDPLDPELGIAWPEGIEPLLSAKDAQAPTLAEALAKGMLPSYEACLAQYAAAAG